MTKNIHLICVYLIYILTGWELLASHVSPASGRLLLVVTQSKTWQSWMRCILETMSFMVSLCFCRYFTIEITVTAMIWTWLLVGRRCAAVYYWLMLSGRCGREGFNKSHRTLSSQEPAPDWLRMEWNQVASSVFSSIWSTVEKKRFLLWTELN